MSNLPSVFGAGAQGLAGILSSKTRVQFIQYNQTVITLDASMSETHSSESTPTEFPVENGPMVSDHIIVKPRSLEITGIISNTPIGGITGLLTEAATSLTSALVPTAALTAISGAVGLASTLASRPEPGQPPVNRATSIYNKLIAMQQSGQPFDVLTSLYRYPSMWIKSLSVPRDAANGSILLFTVSLVQLLLVKPQSVDISIFSNSALAANNANVGNQSNYLVTAAQKGYNTEQSAVSSVFSKGINGGVP